MGVNKQQHSLFWNVCLEKRMTLTAMELFGIGVHLNGGRKEDFRE